MLKPMTARVCVKRAAKKRCSVRRSDHRPSGSLWSTALSRERCLVQVGEAVAGEHRLRHEATERKHGEAAVGELLLLEHLHFLRVRRETERIEACDAAGGQLSGGVPTGCERDVV